ncbi:hypothetical protein HDV57DRAFT_506100 [Trichoderma longibrachiatum]|uniref:Uncharacterized protein n=1 Tax=Trichoderma longibrachiatum ATCC 18648 TaxID=983965 RepID=A0A2T4BPN4_TRILO|nr:hypothetical protein M440DRAFT_219387 [Trichoderma longibrachiatum ATCC 18648]
MHCSVFIDPGSVHSSFDQVLWPSTTKSTFFHDSMTLKHTQSSTMPPVHRPSPAPEEPLGQALSLQGGRIPRPTASDSVVQVQLVFPYSSHYFDGLPRIIPASHLAFSNVMGAQSSSGWGRGCY